MVRVLGIDPALASIGYAVLDGMTVIDYGLITTSSKDKLGDRLVSIVSDIEALANKHEPFIVAIEKPFFMAKNTNAAIVQYALGAILIGLQNVGYGDVLFFNQSAVKMAVTGKGSGRNSSDKHDVKAAVIDLFGLTYTKGADDQYDALAIAYTGLTQPEEAIGHKPKKAKTPRKAKAKASTKAA